MIQPFGVEVPAFIKRKPGAIGIVCAIGIIGKVVPSLQKKPSLSVDFLGGTEPSDKIQQMGILGWLCHSFVNRDAAGEMLPLVGVT
jgi:hypothetical protein